MTKLYFIRHGKTQWNLEGRYQGANGDSPLLRESYDEIEKLATYLGDVHFAHVYASPIKRARMTATHLIKSLPQRVDLTLDSGLREFELGKMEGMYFEDVKKQYPEEYDGFRYHADKYDPTIINGETFADVINRMDPVIKRAAAYHGGADTNLLFISHGAALNAGINGLLNVPLVDMRAQGGLANTSTTILETTDGGQTFTMVARNLTAYLDEVPDATNTI
ncbi:histidine phosphatase family protein [Furfurilactobacillus siliginis]|uniref:Fructose-2,6-bisphosphatase n=1 Tax=Furfurilactobacillus siliginis TaxID=348151 RepID=A0A0R2L367_9LACO|nr:histidine phosphatase family protein [Furfurilactobacillus siliginis]KRN96139.1 fructose-2,6-bisphosphatase [Furfurilactobacillus siliginis]GEK27937.1 phosphoglycerate mutase [Furfurilactobacillus siliginis]